MSRYRLFISALAIGLLAIAGSSALRAEVKEASNVIYVGASGVDDVVEIFVDDQPVGTCSWATSAADCSVRVRVDLGSKTTAKVRFKLTNLIYNGPCFPGPCGKYTGTFYVDGVTGEREFTDTVSCRAASCADGNTAGVKYDRTVTWTR
jgi:hypothetical protein